MRATLQFLTIIPVPAPLEPPASAAAEVYYMAFLIPIKVKPS